MILNRSLRITTIIKTIQSFTVAERLERLPLTNYQIKLMLIVGTAWFFDCIDMAMMTFALSPIKTEFGLSNTQTGLLGSMTFVGMFFGASCAGLLADHFGRLRILQWSMVIWGIASFLCALSPNVHILMICRVFLGVGMAMELIAALALVSELAPTNQRGKFMTYMEGLWPLGFITAGFLSYFLIPIGGWRTLFLAEAIPSLFVFLIRRNLPESPRWLEDRGQKQLAHEIMIKIENNVQKDLGRPLPEPKSLFLNNCPSLRAASLRELFQSNLTKRTIMVWCLWFFALLGYYGLTTWLGALLTEKGYVVTKSSLYLVLISLAGIPGFLTLSKLVETWGRKPSMIFTLLGSAVGAYLYGNAANLVELIIFGLIMQFFMYGMWCALYAYTPDLYPTSLRATGAGFASASGRLGAFIGPYLVGVILPLCGQPGVFMLGAGAFISAALVTFILGEETKGKILEELAHLHS